MQPFLSGETTLALLLTVLTLLFFAAAGDEHPYEPYHHSLPVEAGRSSVVDLSSEQPQQIKGQELIIVRLNGLQTHGSSGGEDHQRVPAKEEEHHHHRRSSGMLVHGPRGAISFQVLFKSGGGADMSTWLLEALFLLLLGLGLPMVATTTTTKKKTTTSSLLLRCPTTTTTTRSKRRKSVRFVDVGGGGAGGHDGGGHDEQRLGQRQRESRGGGEEKSDELQQQQQQQQQQQLQDFGLGLGLTRSVVEAVC
ncbi:hypothetical protein GE21DRAFT_8871 [Neurospora crassa]|uniref:Uncharacterized protein n=1 Tax=Neurospora crassa (strain ATCC 24698 / 74-OR23-1A / CBS 708.71 / DSM 1257 / FGSC 987) TaxID=367110 RepID=Q7S621_NEUCR|nr:hypothetical protein NCU05639 [Neurospora crassa OR74A]EAA30964.1 hypothetical protein NCU05639 [Neurospora crassa OR74A]KHE80556.1 hypothetical protein GE21DRAFT_8871 [Neurospora crassa]|eukprot:XP_960200.1 hypothetical protein NCU05639 [Neurospora crassa OR74A]